MIRSTIPRPHKRGALSALVVLVALSVANVVAAAPPVRPDTTRALVTVGAISGAIGPATRNYVHRIIDESARRHAACLVLLLDTPGGLSSSMRDIIKNILASPVPVAVYVSPSGARAASAGALITLAAHVAAMAPGTNIGAAHPVSIGGGATDSTMQEKITNDAAAYARSIAGRRNRNVHWAERVVRESISSTAKEALADTVVDYVANSLPDLLDKMDGRTVELASGPVVLHTAGAETIDLPLTRREEFLAWISDPNIAYLLMLAGVFGIFFEFQNPGAFFPGILGAIALILAAFALQMLPVSITGLALIALAIVLFVLEVKVPSHGALTLGGIVAMLVGSIMLIDTPVPFMRVSLGVIIPSVLFTALFFIFAVGMALRAQRRKVATGARGLEGERGTARSDVHQRGSVFVHGEYWNAYSNEPIPAGADVEVVHVDGMRLEVRALQPKEVS